MPVSASRTTTPTGKEEKATSRSRECQSCSSLPSFLSIHSQAWARTEMARPTSSYQIPGSPSLADSSQALLLGQTGQDPDPGSECSARISPNFACLKGAPHDQDLCRVRRSAHFRFGTYSGELRSPSSSATCTLAEEAATFCLVFRCAHLDVFNPGREKAAL